MDEISPVIIVGAGPAGLAISALLTQRNISHLVLEKTNQAGGLYARLNPELTFLSPAYFNSLPLSRYKKSGKIATVACYYNYLKKYIQDNQPPLRLNQTIEKIEQDEKSFKLKTTTNRVFHCQKLIIATGMASYPRPLPFTMVHQVEVQDGTQWKGCDYYKKKNVLIIGSGTSAYEYAVLLAGKTNVYLAVKKPIATMPLTLAGINFHWYLRPLELLPKSLLTTLCKGKSRERAINSKIHKCIKQGLVELITEPIVDGVQLRANKRYPNGIDVVLNCTGYEFNSTMLPPQPIYSNGNIVTQACQSVSNSGLFFIGFPCAGGIDSNYLRGIKRDAYRIVKQIC